MEFEFLMLVMIQFYVCSFEFEFTKFEHILKLIQQKNYDLREQIARTLLQIGIVEQQHCYITSKSERETKSCQLIIINIGYKKYGFTVPMQVCKSLEHSQFLSWHCPNSFQTFRTLFFSNFVSAPHSPSASQI